MEPVAYSFSLVHMEMGMVEWKIEIIYLREEDKHHEEGLEKANEKRLFG